MNLKLRNSLSEILIHSLEKGGRSAVFNTLAAYAKAVRAGKNTRVRLSLLGIPAETTRAAIDGSGILQLTGGPADPEADLQSRFWLDAGYLCERMVAYERLLSKIFALTPASQPLDRAVKIGALLFNEALYFECHEYLEGYWREEKGEAKKFLQGIISLATAFYHLERGNRPSALKLLRDGRTRLQPFGPVHRSLGLEALLDQTARFEAWLDGGTASPADPPGRLARPVLPIA